MLSIIIPTLNEEAYLPHLLESIKYQNYRRHEVIIADADSSDSTVEIAKMYGCKITTGGLPGTGRNKGVSIASGEYLLFLDADTVLPPNFLYEILSESYKRQIDTATCLMLPLSEKKIDKILHSAANRYIRITQRFYPHAPGFCILAKKSIHYKINGFNEELKLAEDHDYVRRVSKIGKFRVLSSQKIPVSIRRMEKEGRLKLTMKYVCIEMHRIFRGEIYSNFIHYEFGHKTNDNQSL